MRKRPVCDRLRSYKCRIFRPGEAPLSFDSSSYSTNDPNFSNNKIWKEIERTQGAIETLKKHHDDPNNWEVTNADGTEMARLAFGNGDRIAAVVNDNNTERVLLHVGNHNGYDTYRKKRIKLLLQHLMAQMRNDHNRILLSSNIREIQVIYSMLLLVLNKNKK